MIQLTKETCHLKLFVDDHMSCALNEPSFLVVVKLDLAGNSYT